MRADLVLIFQVWLIMAGIQLLTGGLLLSTWGKRLVDGGWAFGRLIGWLGVGLVVWWLGHLGLDLNWAIWGVSAAGLIGGAGWLFWKRQPIRQELKKKWKWVVTEEVLFLAGLVFLSLMRGFNPAIFDLEKFMDAGLINSYLNASTLPVEDMWLAGEKVNYYTFGHFLGAVMLKWWGVNLAVGYNLLLGLLMGLVLAESFSLVVNLGGGWIGGLAGTMLVTFGGNSQTIWYWLKNHTWQGYWYADATRFIENTIHEFPSYSFVVSDLHAHLWALPVVLLLLVVLTSWQRPFVLLGILLGVLAMANTWDVLIYGLLLVIVVAPTLTLRSFLVAVVVAAPWWLNFESISQGVKLVESRSPIWQLLALWTGHLILTGGAVMVGIKQKNRLVLAMAAVAVVLLVIPELVYVKDIYPLHPRANTMFKLTYQSFVLMSLLGGWLIGQITLRTVPFSLAALPLGTVLITLMLFPYFGYQSYYQDWRGWRGLDGETWLRQRYASDYAGIEWLRKNVEGGPVVLEAVGESYTDFGRVAVFSGLPTVLGWRVHEWLWRGGFEIPAQRTEEVRLVYEAPTDPLVRGILEKYRVRYVFVGSKERGAYAVDEKELEKLGQVVFSSGETKVIAVD